MEPRFGHDFSRVRVHTDSRAVESARAIDALAYTVGSDIVFGAGRYSPATRDGTRLLAHELAHVVQQGQGVALQGKLEIGDVDDGAERAADLVAARVFDRHARLGEVASTAPSPGPGMVRRAAIHVGRILDEGSCAHLACNSVWACKDDENGVLCPKGTKHAGTKRRPLFTCDTKCENGETCDDTDTWMAIPKTRFARNKCGQDLVICANGAFSHGQVRDRSEREAWEVSPGIQSALGVSGSFNGAIYGDVNDAAFKKDSRCGNKPTPKSETKTTAAPPGGESEPETEFVQASPVDEEGSPQEA